MTWPHREGDADRARQGLDRTPFRNEDPRHYEAAEACSLEAEALTAAGLSAAFAEAPRSGPWRIRGTAQAGYGPP